MKDYIVILIIGLLLGLVLYPTLGKALDQEMGDYKKNNRDYKMEVVK